MEVILSKLLVGLLCDWGEHMRALLPEHDKGAKIQDLLLLAFAHALIDIRRP